MPRAAVASRNWRDGSSSNTAAVSTAISSRTLSSNSSSSRSTRQLGQPGVGDGLKPPQPLLGERSGRPCGADARFAATAVTGVLIIVTRVPVLRWSTS